MDVRDNPRFLDAVVTPAGGAPIQLTSNGFRKFLSAYTNGSGQATIVSGVVGGEIQLTERLRADLGVRAEYNTFVQNKENTSTFDLDGDPATPYDSLDLRQQQLPSFQPQHHRLVRLARTQLQSQ